MEGNFARLLDAREHHAHHPERDDVVARHEHVGGIEIFKFGGLVRPAQRREGPERRREPGIEHILVLREVRAAALGADRGRLAGADDLAAVAAVPHGDAVPPPELTGDAPVADVFQPIIIDLRKAIGNKLRFVLHHRVDGGLGKGRHLDEPLLGDDGLHRRMAAVAVTHVVRVRLHLDEKAELLHVRNDALSRLIAVKSRIFACELVHRAVVVHHADDGQIVPKPHFKVVGIVRGRDLHRTRPELGIDILVLNERDLPPHEGQSERLADEGCVPRIAGMHRDGGIAQHGLGSGGRNDDILVRAVHGVFEMPEEARILAVLDLGIRERRLAVGAPVDDAAAAVDEPLVIQAEEGFPHGLRAALVHREGEAGPVAGRAELFELIADAARVLVLPRPGALQKALAPQLLFGEPLFLELIDDLDFRRDGGMVGAGEPEDGIPLHALEARDDVLHGLVHGVAHVQLSRHVGGRHHQREGNFPFVYLGAEAAVFLPIRVDAILKLFGIVRRLHLFHLYHLKKRNTAFHYTRFFRRCQ